MIGPEAARDEERRKWERRVAELQEQHGLDAQTIKTLNSAYATVEEQAQRPQAPPGVEDALAELAAGKTAAAKVILRHTADRKAAEGQIANARAAEAFRQLGAVASLTSAEEALSAYRRAAEFEPNDTWTWIFIARLEQQAGRLAAAENAAERARQAAEAAGEERDVMVADSELGAIHVAQGKLPKAEDAFSAAQTIAERLGGVGPRQRAVAARPHGVALAGCRSSREAARPGERGWSPLEQGSRHDAGAGEVWEARTGGRPYR